MEDLIKKEPYIESLIDFYIMPLVKRKEGRVTEAIARDGETVINPDSLL